jgi:hypothetical protein
MDEWKKENGLLSIWMLGMFNPSPAVIIIIPFNQGSEEELGVPVNDNYFGKIPGDRLKIAGKIFPKKQMAGAEENRAVPGERV